MKMLAHSIPTMELQQWINGVADMWICWIVEQFNFALFLQRCNSCSVQDFHLCQGDTLPALQQARQLNYIHGSLNQLHYGHGFGQ